MARRILKFSLLAFASFLAPGLLYSAVGPAFSGDWTQSAIAPAAQSYEIRGTKGRNNPIRRELSTPFTGEEFFVRFRMRYDAASIDEPGVGDGEFFIMWLDAEDGGDTAGHNGGIPNFGVHVANGKNSFMVRFASNAEKHSKALLEGDREFIVVARLWKSKPGEQEPFENLDLWIDPFPGDEFKPAASASSRKSINEVRWIGFATGGKTEHTDRINVSDIRVSDNWRTILGLPPVTVPKPAYEPEPVPIVKKTVDFKEHVYPILKERCFDCHAGDKPKGGLRLNVMDEALNQATPFDAEASRLIKLVTSSDPDERMPPSKKGEALTAKEVATLRAWIDEGFEWDEALLPTPRPTTDHWSFQPIRRPDVPSVKNVDWVRTPVDAFIARRHEALGLAPSPPADGATLRRRLSLDLIGLPSGTATSERSKISNLKTQNGADAIDAYIEELLYSKHYGERWGRHWLDVARWGESNGYQHNRDRPHAWRYRDYVVRSFNSDKPFDQFIREQIAGDELPYTDESIVGAGFLGAARYSGNELDKEIQRNDILVDIVNTTSRAFLGLTAECAQCHTHKFDPISIRDYYRFQAFFTRGLPGNIVFRGEDDRVASLLAERWRIFDDVHARLVNVRRKKGYPEPILVQPTSVVGGMRPEERKFYDRFNREIAKFKQVWSYYSPATASGKRNVAPHEMRWPLSRDEARLAQRKTYLRIRGDVSSRGPEVEPGWPAVFGPTPDLGDHPRARLADWLAAQENPLTARVWVNRIWQGHFGRGLVETSGDFGVQGSRPTHPELLDWLASELIDNGWSARHIHRLILGSSAYRQASAKHKANAERDPDNLAYWRWRPRRLEAEAIRDSILAVAGVLDLKAGGPSVPLKNAESSNRRSLYLQQKRDKLPHQQMLFDSANAVTSCSRRRVSTVSLQPLYLLNSEFIQRTSKAFATRISSQTVAMEDQARRAIELALGRSARPGELAKARALVEAQGLDAFCLALFNLNEFAYVP